MQSIVSATELSEQHQYPRHLGGTYRFDKWGRLWVYFQAEETLAQGEALEITSYAAINADVDAAAAADTRRVTGTGDFTTTALVGMFGLDSNHEKGGHVYYLWTDVTPGEGQGGPIIQRVDDDNVDVYWATSDDGAIGTALTTSTDYVAFTLSRLSQAATVHQSRHVCYVQRRDGFTDEYWGWGLVRGVGMGQIDGSETAIAAGDKILTSADDGNIEGVTVTTAAEVARSQSTGILDMGAVNGKVPIMANCEVNIAPFWAPGNLTEAYPGGVL